MPDMGGRMFRQCHLVLSVSWSDTQIKAPTAVGAFCVFHPAAPAEKVRKRCARLDVCCANNTHSTSTRDRVIVAVI